MNYSGKENLIIIENDLITYAFNPREWKNRKILKGEKYIPPSTVDPISASEEEIAKILANSKASIVQTMATRLNLGGEYAEEIAVRLGIEKEKASVDFVTLVPEIMGEIRKLLEETALNKAYYYKSANMLSPVKLQSMQEEPEIIEDFNEGLISQMGRIRVV